MILVKIFWNTHPDNTPVNYETVDWDSIEAPVSFYGPFEDMSAAISWIENDYPDDDTDVHDIVADDYDIPSDWFINDPAIVRSERDLDEDIRPDSQEIHGT